MIDFREELNTMNEDLNLNSLLEFPKEKKISARNTMFGNDYINNKPTTVIGPEKPKIRFNTKYVDTDILYVPSLFVTKCHINNYIKFCNLLYEYKHIKNVTQKKKIFKKLYRIMMKYPHIIESVILWYPFTITGHFDFDGDTLPVNELKNDFISSKIIDIKRFKLLVNYMSDNTNLFVNKNIIGRHNNTQIDIKKEINKIYGGNIIGKEQN